MAAAFGSGAMFSLVSGMGGPNQIPSAVSSGAFFALAQGGIYKVCNVFSVILCEEECRTSAHRSFQHLAISILAPWLRILKCSRFEVTHQTAILLHRFRIFIVLFSFVKAYEFLYLCSWEKSSPLNQCWKMIHSMLKQEACCLALASRAMKRTLREDC